MTLPTLWIDQERLLQLLRVTFTRFPELKVEVGRSVQDFFVFVARLYMLDQVLCEMGWSRDRVIQYQESILSDWSRNILSKTDFVFEEIVQGAEVLSCDHGFQRQIKAAIHRACDPYWKGLYR